MQATDPTDAMIERLLVTEEPAEAPESEPEQSEAPDVETEELEAPEAADGEEELAADEPEDNEAPEPEPPRTFTVKVDGKDVEVTEDELKRSYSGQAYIQKGMQEAAEAKKAAKAMYETLQAEQAKFLSIVQSVQQQGFVAPPKAPDIAMMEKDPIGYMQAKALFDRDMEAFQTQQAQIAATQQANQRMQAQALQEFVAEQAKQLQQRIPEFADVAKAGELTGRLRKVGAEAYGFTEQELAGIVDARHVQVLYDAMRYRELVAGKAAAKKSPEPPRNVKPVAKRPEPPQLARSRLLEKAKKSGNPQDFVDLLLQR